ncbi:hypothetical protein CANCADRAFT_131213 [Tortispora caseinolytica NRRL Y-17796]|uniref:Cysteine synthase 1 n=1 Tax=Tortispora caseinolytica NRRL Y-17796 TaxID=767744 RepID=A0A1E4TB08_9ASCO|nr:hypothetical protein CANCADRAFT_131213 [Tortispora caseinolytica NRRL Y-17796]
MRVTQYVLRNIKTALSNDSVRHGLLETVGATPLVRLHGISEETGCEILAKAEQLNPGGSVKDRAALYMIRQAETDGKLQRGGVVVEGTAGNTGIGLAHICKARGYKCVIYMPDTQSQGKINTLRFLGAEVHPVPAVPYDNPENFNHQAKRHGESLKNAVWTDQFDNLANRQAHIETTGPEIWAQTNGKIDAFVCATGTGGSLAGVTSYLKDISRGKTQCYLADPPGSVLYTYITSGGKLIERSGSSITEGIGQGRVTNNLAQDIEKLDGALHIKDEDTIAMLFRILDEEGFDLGASSSLNVRAAYELAKKLGPGHTIVTLMCDGVGRYADRIFSKKWIQSKGLWDAIPEEYKHYLILD